MIHWKLSAETSNNRQVTPINSKVPPSHRINSIRPGRNNHQRVRSSGLNVSTCCARLRLPGRIINCADGEPLAAPAVQEREPVPAGAFCGATIKARCPCPCPGGSVSIWSMSRAGDTRGGTVSISSTLGKRRVVALFGAGGWGCVGVSGINKESMGRLPAASKCGDSYCQIGDAACGSGVRSLVALCGMTC